MEMIIAFMMTVTVVAVLATLVVGDPRTRPQDEYHGHRLPPVR